MKKPYVKIYDLLLRFHRSKDAVQEVDTTQWTSDKVACDDIRRTIKQKGFKDIYVVQRRGKVFLFKRTKDAVFVKTGEIKENT